MSDPRPLAEKIHDIADGAAERAVARLAPRFAYGVVVGEPNPTTRTVDVALRGMPEVSPGFVYLEHEPAAGDVVQVVTLSTGDRFVSAIVGRNLPTGAVRVVDGLPEATAERRGELLLVETDATDDELYICRRVAAGTYAWALLTV